MSFFNVHSIFFTFLGYPMSYIEFSATLLIVIYVLLITRRILWAWPIGIISFILFAVLFYQVRLYSDFFEQFYYIGNGFYGWWLWLASRKDSENKEMEISYSSAKIKIITASIIAAGFAVLGFMMSRIHIYLPSLFPNPAAFPYIDAFATVMGFAAAATVIAAIIARANTKGTLYPVLSFPILLPLLLTVINATRLASEGAFFREALGEFQILISYIVVVVVTSYLLFEYIWKD